MEILTTYLVVIATFLVGIIGYYKLIYNVWARKNIPYHEENQFIFLLRGVLQKYCFAMKVKKMYATAKAAGHKNLGLFLLGKPVYMPIDSKIIKDILMTDFHKFTDRGFYYNKESNPISASLFVLDGQEWKNLRIKLTPTFTSGKIKTMIYNVIECAEQLNNAVGNLASLNEPFNIRELAGMFTVDVIGSCAFGLNCNTFDNKNSDFLKYSKKFFQNDIKHAVNGLISFCFPSFAKSIGISLVDQDVSDFFSKIVREAIEYREKHNIVRNDFLHLLLNINKEHGKNESNSFTFEEITAQSFLFFLAGFETSSSTISFILYALSINPDIQDKVREEVNSVLEIHGGKVTYEAIMDMKYLDQVMKEALRKYPTLPVLARRNVEDYKIPGTDQILEKGTSILIPSIGIHYDPEYFPDPEKFDPDRFSYENKNTINPYTYLPFGEGPRNCIGLRFGVMQVKVGVTYLLKDFKFSLNDKTQTPIKMDPTSVVLSVLGGIWLDATKV